jgi:hypothetical protein
MTGSEMTLARYYAKQAIKAQWRSQGIRWQYAEASELAHEARTYLSDHPELIERACASLERFAQQRKR